MAWYRALLPWLCAVVLSSCASTSPSLDENEAVAEYVEEYPEAYTRLEEGACVTFLFAGEACGLFRCEDVLPGQVVRARGTFVIPPSAVRSPQRNWGYPWQVPGRPEPVFVIPWHGRELLPSQRKVLEMAGTICIATPGS